MYKILEIVLVRLKLHMGITKIQDSIIRPLNFTGSVFGSKTKHFAPPHTLLLRMAPKFK